MQLWGNAWGSLQWTKHQIWEEYVLPIDNLHDDVITTIIVI